MRAACAEVAALARSVRIEEGAIAAYAAGLPPPGPPEPDPRLQLPGADREARAAFAVCLDAVNFGSGWWPTIRKRPGHSGFFTVAAGLADRFRAAGPWPAPDLAGLTGEEVAATLGQDPAHPLMAQFAAALRDVGARLLAEHGGSFATAVDSVAPSAPALAGLFASWHAFADVSIYREREPRAPRALLQARPAARRRPRPRRRRRARRPRPPHRLRRQPGALTSSASTASSPSTPTSPPGSKPGGCSSTAPPRRSSCAPPPSTRSSSSPPPAPT